jgi:hypothetical protein
MVVADKDDFTKGYKRLKLAVFILYLLDRREDCIHYVRSLPFLLEILSAKGQRR